ncbi:MAG: ABC transporter substrate-binding protein [Acidimicrobiales bacterium]
MKRTWLILFVVLSLLAAACGDDDDGAVSDASADDTASDDATGDGDTAAPATGDFDIDAVLAADPDCASPLSGDGLVIGYAADFSDLGGFADGPGTAAVEHFVRQINCSGGVDGTPVTFVVEDISGDPEATQRAAQDLLEAGAVGLIGPPFPDFGFPLLQVTAGEVPVIFSASTEPSLADLDALSYLGAFDDTQQATAAAEFALDQGWTTAITFSAPGPYFGYNPEVFTDVFTAGGGEVLSDFNFVPIDDVDFSTQVNEIANGDTPDVIYSAMLSFQLTALKGQMEGAGVETSYMSTDAFEATGGYFGDNIEGIYHTTHAFPTAGDRFNALEDSFAAATGSGSEAPVFAALAVEAAVAIIDAYLATGKSTDPAEIGAAIADVDVEGVTGDYSYAGSATPTKTVYIHQVVDGAPSLAGTSG